MIRSFLGSMLNDLLRKNMKRKIFLASFAAVMQGVTTYDREAFQKLDRVLSLSERNEDGLAVPVMLSKAIWNGKTAQEICGEDVCVGAFNAERIASIVNHILIVAPACLLYGTKEEIEHDVSVILRDRTELLGA